MLKTTISVLNSKGLEGTLIPKPTEFLGLSYIYNADGSVMAHQTSNIRQLIATIGMEDAKSCQTPIDPQREEEKEEESPQDSNHPLSIHLWPTIWILQTIHAACFTVPRLCRKMSDPNETDYGAAKRRYLIGMKGQGLTYHGAC